jgi:SAM-dependent methyltransferase
MVTVCEILAPAISWVRRNLARQPATVVAAEPVAENSAVPESAACLRVVVNRNGSELVLEPDNLAEFSFSTGDEIAITPLEAESKLQRTPDGCVHIAVGPMRYRLPTKYVLTPHKDFMFPEHLVTLTGAGTETLEVFGTLHLECYKKFMGLSPDMTILELGCGIGRDALQFLNMLNEEGRYIGIDVTWDSVAWCQRNISSKYPNFKFFHFDAAHELYNPLGSKTSLDFRLPVPDRSVDRICAGSVFTHLFEEEVVHYMREIGRVLKPDGLAYTTFFLYSDETIEAARRTNLTHNNLMFNHSYADGCYINDPGYPTGAVAFTDAAMRRMMERAGVRLARPYLGGAWSGLHTDAADGQEVAILKV